MTIYPLSLKACQMKRCIGFFLFFISIAAVQSALAQTKHALIFAIGNYPQQGGWEVISSLRDVPYVKSTLFKHGFLEDNIKTVADADATVHGITDALTELIHTVQPGDVTVIHFSSHGEQVEDDNNDEPDGKDECIATYHAVIPRLSKDFKKDQAAYFRDDQFGTLINQLRKKLGNMGDVVVFMNLCHSGSGTRGFAKVRGGQPPLVSAEFNKQRYTTKDSSSIFKESNAGNENDMASYVVISATRAEELDFETKDDNNEGIGSLTYALSKAFENLDAGVTYRSLFTKIQSVMHMKTPGQHPVLEGDGLDRILFGGKFVTQKPYIEIEKIRGRQLIIKAGVLSGLDIGARVSLHPAGTYDHSKVPALAEGTVTKAENFTATVSMDKDPEIKQPVAGWVFVTEPVYKIKPVSIGVVSDKGSDHAIAFSITDATKIKEQLKGLPLVNFDGNPELLVVKGDIEDSVKIASNGHLFDTIQNTPANPDGLKQRVERYIQYKFLQSIEIKHPHAIVDIKLVPYINGRADTTKINNRISNGMYEFTTEDTIAVLVRNPGKEPVFLNVLDMQPDGFLNAVYPTKRKEVYPQDLKIEAGATRLFDGKYRIEFSPPYGTEIFKVFVSTKEIDMEGIATTKGEATRGNFTGLEKLLKDSYKLSYRGAGVLTTDHADGSAFNILFKIKPAR